MDYCHNSDGITVLCLARLGQLLISVGSLMLPIFSATFSMIPMYKGRFEGNINPPTRITGFNINLSFSISPGG